MRVAIAGGGMISENHQAALEELADMELVGVFDADPERTRARAAEWGVKAYGSLNELLADEAVEAVEVLTPAETHLEVAGACAEAGKHVLCEKPISHDPAEIERLIAIRDAAGVVVMPAHNFAYSPEFRRIVRLAKRGDLGKLRGIWVHHNVPLPEEIGRLYKGVIRDVMVHHLYLSLAIAGAPEAIYAGKAEPTWEDFDYEDQAWMTLEDGAGLSSHLFASWAVGDDSADPWSFVIKVLGEKGSASMTWRSAWVERERGLLKVGIPVFEETFREEIAAFRDAVEGTEPPLSSLEDALTGARLALAAGRAAAERRAISREEGGW